MNYNSLYNLSSKFLSLATSHAHMNEEEVKLFISNELSLIKDILLSVEGKSPSEISDSALQVKNAASKCMKLVRQHLPPQGRRSWSEYRINAMTTAYYGLSSYADTGSLSGINEAIRVVEELLE